MKQENPSRKYKWSDKSVVQFAEGQDPIRKMESKARDAVLTAVEEGWQGPPFDPIELAELRGIGVRPNAAIADARVFWSDGHFEIEYNPHRSRARLNFSIAHEIAHTFFEDCANVVRNRSRERWDPSNWQLEVLCNLGAAEMLMPFGTLTPDEAIVTIEEMMRLRKEFQVSAESILIRLVKLASSRIACFSATRLESDKGVGEYSLHYHISSTSWPELEWAIRNSRRFVSSVLDGCVAIGTTSKGKERWDHAAAELQVEAVGLPPLPGTQNLRLAGFVQPASEVADVRTIGYRQGDASTFAAESNAAIVHIVNDRAHRWVGKGFALAMRRKFPDVYDEYVSWSTGCPEQRRLGAIHIGELDKNRYVISLVAQSGYGKSKYARIRYSALDSALIETVRVLSDLGVHLVQMPKIGTGQAGGNWDVIEGLIRERLVAAGLQVRVFDPPPQ